MTKIAINGRDQMLGVPTKKTQPSSEFHLAIESESTASLTSGVTSRVPNPVPPVVIIQSIFPASVQALIDACIRGISSGTITGARHENPLRASTISLIVGPDRSDVPSAEALSLTWKGGGCKRNRALFFH